MCDNDAKTIDALKQIKGLLKVSFYCEECKNVFTMYNVPNFDKMYNPEMKPKHQFGRKNKNERP